MANQTVTVTSQKFWLNIRDLAKAALMTAITAALAIIGQSLNSGTLPTLAQLKIAGMAGLTAGIGYILKNFFSSSEITIKNAPSELVKSVKSGESTVLVTPTNS